MSEDEEMTNVNGDMHTQIYMQYEKMLRKIFPGQGNVMQRFEHTKKCRDDDLPITKCGMCLKEGM